MAKESTGVHTPDSIEHVASRLDEIVAQVRASAVLLGAVGITSVEVRYERSLTDGLAFLENWANALKSTAHDQVMQSKKQRVSAANGTVSDSGHEPRKTKRK